MGFPFPIEFKRANGVSVVRGALFNHRWSSSLDWWLLFVDRVVVNLFTSLSGLNDYCTSVTRFIYCVLKLFRLPLAVLTIMDKDSKEAINHALTARTPMIGLGL